MAKKEKINKKAEAMKANWVRTQADFDNYKKIVEREKLLWTSSAKEDALSEILPVLDNLHFAIKHKPQELNDNSWATGIDHISSQIDEKLRELNIERISPQTNEKFNPAFHEAVTSLPDKNVKSGNISELVRPGYKIGDRVIRPAQVNVSK